MGNSSPSNSVRPFLDPSHNDQIFDVTRLVTLGLRVLQRQCNAFSLINQESAADRGEV